MLITALAYFNAKAEVDELFDSNLKQISRSLANERQALELLEKKYPLSAEYDDDKNSRKKLKGEEEFLIQIWDNGRLVYSSHPVIAFPKLEKEGLNDSIFEDEVWHTYLEKVENSEIQVSQPLEARSEMVEEIALKFIVPLFLQLPILALLIWFTVGKSLQPLVTLSADIQKRHSNLLQPLSQEFVPVEVTPLLTALNDLLERLNISMQAQRQFTADAAHELRTPLTAIQLQLEILKRAKNDDERHDAILKLSAGIFRSIHLVQQLLLLARLEPEAATITNTNVQLAILAKSCVEQLAPQAASKEINLGSSHLEEITINGDAEGLRVMLTNLIDNAIRYTPEGGKIDVNIKNKSGRAIIEVADNGIGIALEERSRIFDRFYRVTGSGALGTGIGLAIVKAITDRHNSEITVADGLDSKGITFTVIFP